MKNMEQLYEKNIPDLPQLYTVPQIAEILRISKSFAYKLIAVGEIPHVKVGTAIRVRCKDLLDYIEKNLEPSPRAIL